MFIQVPPAQIFRAKTNLAMSTELNHPHPLHIYFVKNPSTLKASSQEQLLCGTDSHVGAFLNTTMSTSLSHSLSSASINIG